MNFHDGLNWPSSSSDLCPNKCTWPRPKCFPLCRCLTFVRCYAFTPNDHAMLGREDGFDAITVLGSFHLVLVIFSPSLEVRGNEDDYDSLMCGLLGYIFACPCGPRCKAMFTLRFRLRAHLCACGATPDQTCPSFSDFRPLHGLHDYRRGPALAKSDLPPLQFWRPPPIRPSNRLSLL
jgi:hypothetical protein